MLTESSGLTVEPSPAVYGSYELAVAARAELRPTLALNLPAAPATREDVALIAAPAAPNANRIGEVPGADFGAAAGSLAIAFANGVGIAGGGAAGGSMASARGRVAV